MQKHSVHDFIDFNDDKFTKRNVCKNDNTTIFILNFTPGQTLPAHKHPGSQLQLLVLQGSGVFTIDGNATEVNKDDVLFLNGDEELAFFNNSTSNVSLYVTLTKVSD